MDSTVRRSGSLASLREGNRRRVIDAFVRRAPASPRATVDPRLSSLTPRELEVLRHYLDIQLVRFSDRLSVRFDIDPAARDADPETQRQQCLARLVQQGERAVPAAFREPVGRSRSPVAGRNTFLLPATR